MDILLITNNCDCEEAFSEKCACLFNESWDYGRVLREARDKIHAGYVLLGHPQSGSVKPNQTPYRTIVLTEGQDGFNSVLMIEQAISTYEKFQKIRPTPDWPEEVLEDFRIIDMSLAREVLSSLRFIE